MMLMYSIVCQMFSRGVLLKTCFEQEKWEVLMMMLFVGIAIGSPVQGHMSDKTSRKKILILTISAVVVSMLIALVGQYQYSKEQFPFLLGLACVINGFFGNGFGGAAAAYSERCGDLEKTTRLAFACRNGGIILPLVLPFHVFYSFLIALLINLLSLTMILFRFKDCKLIRE